MNRKQTIEWLQSMPEEFDEFELIFREVKKDPENEKQLICHDTPIVAGSVDKETKEICLFELDSYHVMEDFEKQAKEEQKES